MMSIDEGADWPALPDNIQRLADTIQESFVGLEHINAMREVFTSPSTTIWGFHPRILALSFRPFKNTPPVTTLDRPLGELVVEVGCSLHLLSIALLTASCSKTTKRVSVPKLARSHILPHWPTIFEWMELVYYFPGGTNTAFGSGYRDLSCVANFEVIFSIIFQGSDHEDAVLERLRSDICHTPGVLKLVIEVWTRQLDLPKQGTDYELDHAIDKLLDGPDKDDLDFSFGLEKSKLVALLMRRVRYISYGSHSKLRLRGYRSMISVYSLFALCTPTLLEDLVSEGLLVALLDGISSLLSVKVLPHPVTTQDLNVAFGLIDVISFAMDGNRRWLRTVLRHKFIPLLLQFERLPGQHDGMEIKTAHVVGRLLLPYALHPSILPPFAKAVQPFLPFHPSNDTGVSQDVKDLRALWNDFKFLVASFSAQRGDFLKLGEHLLKGSWAQMNVMLAKNTSSSITNTAKTIVRAIEMVCPINLIIDTENYMLIHDQERNIDLFHVSLRDRAFFTHVANNYVLQAESTIKKDLRLKLSDKSFQGSEQIILFLDFAGFPLVNSLVPAEEFLPHPGKPRSILIHAPFKARARRPKAARLIARVLQQECDDSMGRHLVRGKVAHSCPVIRVRPQILL
ncbi:hypothetical protein DXG01_002711 [Tephrocybe rancida]|nr:hypothetical protein DXG01_002711 [Tephrocybe rancida]